MPRATTLSLGTGLASLLRKTAPSLHTGIKYNKLLLAEDKSKVRVQGKVSHCLCARVLMRVRTHMHTQRHSSHCVRVYLKEKGSGERSFMDSFVKEKEQQPNQG